MSNLLADNHTLLRRGNHIEKHVNIHNALNRNSARFKGIESETAESRCNSERPTTLQ